MISVPSLAILVSAVVVLSCGPNHRQTERQSQRRINAITEADQRYTHATTVAGVIKSRCYFPSLWTDKCKAQALFSGRQKIEKRV